MNVKNHNFAFLVTFTKSEGRKDMIRVEWMYDNENQRYFSASRVDFTCRHRESYDQEKQIKKKIQEKTPTESMTFNFSRSNFAIAPFFLLKIKNYGLF